MSQRRLGWGGAGGVSGPGLPVILVSGGWTRDAGPPGVVRLTTSTDQVGVGTVVPLAGSRVEVSQNDANNATFTDVQVVTHTTSGAPAAGIGVGLLLRSQGAAGTENAARIVGLLTNTGAGTEAGALDVYTRTGGGALAATWRFDGAGALLPAASGQPVGSSSQRPDIYARAFNSPARAVTAAGVDNVLTTDSVVTYDATLGNQTPTLPALSSAPGLHVWIKRLATDVSGNLVTITPQAGEFVDGSGTAPITSGQSLHLYAPTYGGTNWIIL